MWQPMMNSMCFCEQNSYYWISLFRFVQKNIIEMLKITDCKLVKWLNSSNVIVRLNLNINRLLDVIQTTIKHIQYRKHWIFGNLHLSSEEEAFLGGSWWGSGRWWSEFYPETQAEARACIRIRPTNQAELVVQSGTPFSMLPLHSAPLCEAGSWAWGEGVW